ncbi:MAG TPA: DUF2510 domain-containing protein [Acidimicrobiia bacterium]|nr:DUF2510 domain-containing protein [Acidimicrobiia bacterium]
MNAAPRAPGPSLRTALIVGAIGLVLGVPGAVIGIGKIVRTISSPVYATPVTIHRELEHGEYMVYEDLSRSTRVITPADVSVLGADNTPVATHLTDRSEEVPVGSSKYTGIVAFSTPSAGSYDITVRTTGTYVVVSRSLVDTVRNAAAWFFLAGVGGMLLTIGVIMLIVGAVRRGRAERTGYVYSANAPAGWYPNPDGTNSQRWWDGARWSDYTNPPH